jgi:hypothetical protein
MRTKTTTIFQFDELSDAAKEKARQWWRDGENETIGSDPYILEPYETAAKLIGIELKTHSVSLMNGELREEPNIWWSLHVPGSGASFEGQWNFSADAVKAVRAEFRDEKLNDIAVRLMAFESAQKLLNGRGGGGASITIGGREVHEYAMSVDVFDGEGGDQVDAEAADLFLEIMRDFARWIHQGISDEYDSRQEDEYVDDAIRANEYEFDEDGNRAD